MLKNYTLTDMIRFQNKRGLEYNNTIVKKYLTLVDENYPANFPWLVNRELLPTIAAGYEYHLKNKHGVKNG